MFRPDAVAHSTAPEITEPGPDATQRMMLLAAGGHLFALPLDAVREILPARPFTPLPGSAAAVCGLINVRGRIVTVFDLAALLRLPAAADDPAHSVVLLDCGGQRVGLAVADLLRIMDVDRGAIGDPADTMRALGLERDYVLGVGEIDERLFVALDPLAIVRPLLAQQRQ